MSTFEPTDTTAAILDESRALLKLFATAIRAATPERTQEWERRIERVLEDGRALIDEAELGERIQRAFVERVPMRKLALVRRTRFDDDGGSAA